MQDTQNNGLEKGIGLFALVITFIMFRLAVAYYGGFTPLLNALDTFFNNLFNFFSFDWLAPYKIWFISGLKLLTVILIIFSFICISIFLKYLFKKILELILDYLEEKRFIKNNKKEIEYLLFKETDSDLESLKNEINLVRNLIVVSRSYKKLNRFTKELEERLKTCLKLLEKLKRKFLTEITKNEIEENERKNKEIDEQNRINESYNESDDELILYKLNAEETLVFIKSKLSENQIRALKSNNFKEINEYSVKENKIIRVLVKRKPNLNHTTTHIFLVWDTIRLLNEIKGITNIQEHDTVDADITFIFNNKKYALEIERGDLLRKKDQQKEKIEELNKKYPKRWMFIVSNKNYLSRYQKLGFSTQRKQVSENLQKLLEN